MEFINTWIQGIIVAVVIGTVIEMILPNGNSKKYIKMIIGIFIIFNIISPLVTKFTGKEFKIDEIMDLNKYKKEIEAYEINNKKIDNSNNSNIKEVYILNLKKDMKNKIEDKGYIVNRIQIEVDDNDEYTVNKVDLIINKKENKEKSQQEENDNTNKIEKVEEINIEKIELNNTNQIKEESKELNNTLTSKEINDIKDYINSTYEINKSKIQINN